MSGDTRSTFDGFERDLVRALQPIRQGMLAQVLFQFLTTGWYESLTRGAGRTVAELADDLGLDAPRFRGLLRYLDNEGVVELRADDTVQLTDFGEQLGRFRPWYELLVGGYGLSFRNLAAVLKSDGPYAGREAAWVATGSCGISQFDALPMTRALLARIATTVRTVVDIGCGDGSYLLDLCAAVPAVRGIGFELDASTVDAGNASARARGLADRIAIRQGHRGTDVPDVDDLDGPICFITAFVLQELLEQSGRGAVVALLRDSFDRHPDAHWIVVEVDHRPDDPDVMGHPLGLAYYNPYYLLHVLTEQRLETVGFWTELFAEAGVRVLAEERPDPHIDSLGLKVGFLLGRQSEAR